MQVNHTWILPRELEKNDGLGVWIVDRENMAESIWWFFVFGAIGIFHHLKG